MKKMNNRKANIIQQSSLFTNNYETLGFLLKAASLFQTKWTLTHELTRFRKQSVSVTKTNKNFLDLIKNTYLSHCVGHGLFVKYEHLLKYKIPTETVNEDLPFGYYQCALGEPILPIRILENSDSPETITSLINQKKVWFWPYLEYLKCRNIVIERGQLRNKMELNLLTYQAIFTGIVWFFQSFIFLTPLIIGLILLNKMLLLSWIIAISLYWIIPITLVYMKLPALENQANGKKSSLQIHDLLLIYISGILNIFMHSLGPILCFYQYIQIKLGRSRLVKDKTER
jgi:hypothetical protein